MKSVARECCSRGLYIRGFYMMTLMNCVLEIYVHDIIMTINPPLGVEVPQM